MDESIREFLAAEVLNDGKTSQRSPTSIHATYILTGTKVSPEQTTSGDHHAKDGDDAYMQSSPYLSSSMPNQDGEPIQETTVTLVRQEDLEKVNRAIQVAYANEDPLQFAGTYGTVQNPNVKRRSARRPQLSSQPPSRPSSASRAIDPKQEKATTGANRHTAPMPKVETGTNEPSLGRVKEAKSARPEEKHPKLNREGSSLAKSFAKSKPKLKREDTDSSAAVSLDREGAEDAMMKDASEEEQEDDLVLHSRADRSGGSGEQVTRAQRQEQLRQMMEDDDEPTEEPAVASQDEESEDNAPEVAEASEPAQTTEVQEPPTVLDNGRRRGRRRVTKKRTVKDDEGYLVTREETGWESFSESEAELSKKTTPASTVSSAAGGGSKKTTGKPGQGSLMSWFGKKRGG
ncbi:MAG: hypothetical protein M1817_005281 [Caeruleum heppii]|nr:MAG: hypothetical protein M1817_005281 [Caeruleum heppii]